MERSGCGALDCEAALDCHDGAQSLEFRHVDGRVQRASSWMAPGRDAGAVYLQRVQ
jgi:hypothetical protein